MLINDVAFDEMKHLTIQLEVNYLKHAFVNQLHTTTHTTVSGFINPHTKTPGDFHCSTTKAGWYIENIPYICNFLLAIKYIVVILFFYSSSKIPLKDSSKLIWTLRTGWGCLFIGTDYGSWTCILAISDSLQLKHLNGGCFLQTCKFSLHKTLIDGLELCRLLVDYCSVFINFFNSLSTFINSHSDGTHSLKWCNATFLKICSDEETTSKRLEASKYKTHFHFWVKYAQCFFFIFMFTAQAHHGFIHICKCIFY